MPTAHISADPGAFAETVLLPGDPLRAKHIADTYLVDCEQVTAVRNMYGYTGTFQGKRVSVMGTGMGIPSASIYSTELVKDYGVRNLIRVGTCGAVDPEVGMGDVILGMGACTDSGVNRARFAGYDFAAIADWELLSTAHAAAEALKVAVRVGNLFSGDFFYVPDETIFDVFGRMGVLAVEMEAAGIYGVAAEYGARALTVCTVSDHILTGEQASSQDRETAYGSMMEIALHTAAGI